MTNSLIFFAIVIVDEELAEMHVREDPAGIDGLKTTPF